MGGGGGVGGCSNPPPLPPPPTAVALYNDAFTIFIPAAPCDAAFVEFYFLKALQNKESHAQWQIIVPLIFLCGILLLKGFAC